MAAGLQERLEARKAGRVLISALIAVSLLAVGLTNLPDSPIRREGLKVAQPYLEATGLEQSWKLFAPQPRRASLRLLARVRYLDGSVAIWRPRSGNALTGTYWDYRWRKWVENLSQGTRAETLRAAAAPYIARQMRRPGKAPTTVTLIEQAQVLRPPGARGSEVGPWESRVLVSAPVGGTTVEAR
jgi:hypothetical protein